MGWRKNLWQAHRQALEDIRTRWHRSLAWFFFLGLCWCMANLYLLTYGYGNKSSACLPDGSFNIYPSSFRYWSWSGFFQVTVGFGTLNFTQAKAIDITWDVVSELIRYHSGTPFSKQSGRMVNVDQGIWPRWTGPACCRVMERF